MKGEFLSVPDEVWEFVRPLIPVRPRNPKGGRPPVHDRLVFNGIVYRACAPVASGMQSPREFGSPTTCYDRFREWAALGVFEAFHAAMVRYYDREVAVDLQWCSMDSATVKAPKGGTSRAPVRPIARKAAASATF